MQMNNSQNLTPDEAKASLGIATWLQDKLIPKVSEASQTPENAPTDKETPETGEDTITPRIDDLEGKFDELKETVEKTVKDGINELKQEIKDALENETIEDNDTTE